MPNKHGRLASRICKQCMCCADLNVCFCQLIFHDLNRTNEIRYNEHIQKKKN